MSLIKPRLNTLGRRTNSAINQAQILDRIDLSGKFEIFIPVDKRFSRIEMVFEDIRISNTSDGIYVIFSVDGGITYLSTSLYRQHHSITGVGIPIQFTAYSTTSTFILLTDTSGLSNSLLGDYTGNLTVYSPTSKRFKMIDFSNTQLYAGNIVLGQAGICMFNNTSPITNIRLNCRGAPSNTTIWSRGNVTIIGYP